MKVSIYILDKVSTVVLSEQEDKVKIFANSGKQTPRQNSHRQVIKNNYTYTGKHIIKHILYNLRYYNEIIQKFNIHLK